MLRKALVVLLFLGTWQGLALGWDGGKGKPAAIVNGEAIPAEWVEETVRNSLEGPGPASKERIADAWKSCLDSAIDDVLIGQFLTRMDVPLPSAEDVNKALKELDWPHNRASSFAAAREAIRLQGETYVNSLPDARLKPYYDKNKLFFDKVTVRASHIRLTLPPNVGAEERNGVVVKLRRIRREILAGKTNFADAAEKYSACPSKSRGGDVGFFRFKDDVVEPFARAAFALKVGEISDVVETELGLHLIKVTERTNAQTSNFRECKESVREYYAQELYENILKKERAKARIKIFPPPS